MLCKNIDDISYKEHNPVLLLELVNNINIEKKRENIIVDCTLWLAGHAIEIIKKMNLGDRFIWFDTDIRNLELAKKKLEGLWKNGVSIILINSNFINLEEELRKIWIKKITWIYYDLWISSLHVDSWERWFSFKIDWPLDMRFNINSSNNALYVINNYKESDLRKIFFKFWEEKKSTKIAKKIIEERKKKKIKTTKELKDIIEKVSRDPKSKNRIFQAIRIEVNAELENLEKSLNQAINILEVGGNIFVISFHSLEDRIVKNIFRRETRDCICNDLICSCKHKKSLKILNKKLIIPSEKELENNPRSRSAKARVGEKLAIN